MQPSPYTFNSDRDTRFAHSHPELSSVLHVVHAEWHGIRSATASLPGHKLTIPHDRKLDAEELRHFYGLIFQHSIQKICFQGFSDCAEALALDAKRNLSDSVRLYAVTHVTSAQFEHNFELQMQVRLKHLRAIGVIAGLGSVKPNFASVVDTYWPRTLVNAHPNFQGRVRDGMPFSAKTVFIPVENTWRKNLHTNILAACGSDRVHSILTVNWPTGLEAIADLSRVRHVGYKRGTELYGLMASASLVLSVTLAECQPMTALEALAVGTPCLTGPLGLVEFESDPLTELIETPILDNPASIRKSMDRLIELRSSQPVDLAQMIDEHLARRLAACFQSYGEFLEI